MQSRFKIEVVCRLVGQVYHDSDVCW